MFDWFGRTLKRYKRGLYITGIVAGGMVTLGYVCKQKLVTWQQDQLASLLRNTHIDQHTLQHLQNTSSTLTGYFDTIYQKINEQCDTESTVKQLKSGTIQKLEGWQLLKHQCFTKLLLTLYTSSIIAVFVSVQLTVVSSNIFKSLARRSDSRDKTTQLYLGKIRRILDLLIPELHRICDREVSRIFGGISLDDKLNFGDIVDLLDNINIASSLNFAKLCKIELESEEEIGNQNLRTIFLQTYDILDSDDFRYTCISCIEHNRQHLAKRVHEVMKQEDVLVAKLIPAISKIPGKLMYKEKDEYVSHILGCNILRMLDINLYQGLTNN